MKLSNCKICVATLVDILYADTAHHTWITLEDYDDFEALEARVDRLIDSSPTRVIGEAQGIGNKQSRAYLIHASEGFPQGMIDESSSLEEIWSLWEDIQEAIEDGNEEAFKEYLSNFWSGSYSDFQDRYRGRYDSESAFAKELLEDLGVLDTIPEHLRYYFDYEAYARDLFIGEFTMLEGYVFCNC